MTLRRALIVAAFLTLTLPLAAQNSTNEAPAASVPPVMQFSGVATDDTGRPLSGTVTITFSLYDNLQGGTSLWSESQNVALDASGHYSVYLGLATSEGLPATLFTSGEAHWLSVRIAGQPEQPRVFLVSVPYAMKAEDAQTIGGLPPSAFMLANPAKELAGSASAEAAGANSGKVKPAANSDVTGVGTVDYIPMWDTTSDIIDSIIFQKSSEIGISTTTPAALLDVNGKTDVRDTLTLYPKSTDNTLAVNGTSFVISSTGKVTFISGQTFPGTGTITGITTASGSGLSGGGTTGTLSLKIPSAGVTNAMLANSKVTLNASTAGGLTVPGAMTLGDTYTIGLKTCSTDQVLEYSGSAWTCSAVGTGTITGVTAGTDLTGGGTSGKVTLDLDTTKVPTLAASNYFTTTQTISAGTASVGLYGSATGIGVSGVGSSTSGYGVNGQGYYGVGGQTFTSGGSGVVGEDESSSGATGVFGLSVYGGTGVSGESISNTTGTGVYGSGATYGVYGTTSNNGSSGVYGNDASSSGGYGVIGNSTNGTGVHGYGLTYGVYGSALTYGVFGIGQTGVYGTTWQEFAGLGAIYGYGTPPNYSGNFDGTVNVTGYLTKTGGGFMIDHPLDPANKYLYHSFVESPDMKNIYDGIAVLGESGSAWVTLPDYFEALNRDFRYQLTAVGAPGPNLYIAIEIAGNRFQIAGGTPGGKVSWQVTGIRQDAYAKAHPIISEVAKTGDERGRYRHPVELGQPKSLGIDEYRRSKMHLPEAPKRFEQAAQLAPPKPVPPRPQPSQFHQSPAPQPPQVKLPAAQTSLAVPDPAK